MRAVTLGALVNVVVNPIPIPRLRTAGAATATILCESAVLTLMYRGSSRVVPVRLLSNFRRPLLSCFPMTLAVVLSRNVFLSLQVLFGGVSYGAAMMLLGGLKTEDLVVARSFFRSQLSPAA